MKTSVTLLDFVENIERDGFAIFSSIVDASAPADLERALERFAGKPGALEADRRKS